MNARCEVSVELIEQLNRALGDPPVPSDGPSPADATLMQALRVLNVTPLPYVFEDTLGDLEARLEFLRLDDPMVSAVYDVARVRSMTPQQRSTLLAYFAVQRYQVMQKQLIEAVNTRPPAPILIDKKDLFGQ